MLAWESATLTLPIQRCGAVRFGRVNAEEDVNMDRDSDSLIPSDPSNVAVSRPLMTATVE